MGCQRAIAQRLGEKGADDVLTRKGHPGTLPEEGWDNAYLTKALFS